LLSSTSDRRACLLSDYGYRFERAAPEVRESRHFQESAVDLVTRLAAEKASASHHPRRVARLVLGADTIVLDGTTILGKPRDAQHARALLRGLRGKSVGVLTGVALRLDCDSPVMVVSHVKSTVRFRKVDDKLIDSYVSTGDPLDRAGAFSVQGRGRDLISGWRGCFTNVVGLPMCEVSRMMGWFGHENADARQCHDERGIPCPRIGTDLEERWLYSWKEIN
jgi:septum formation protein